MRIGSAMRIYLLVACAMCATLAGARMSPDPSGLWYDAAESGWGLTLQQQGEQVFAALYVYDDSHRPTWYVASNMQPATLFTPTGALSNDATGTLYRTMGPWFGGAFDPAQVAVAPVGQIHVAYAADGKSLDVTYSIDGRSVSKTLRPQTWATDRALLAGNYAGGLFVPNHSATCAPMTFTGNASASVMTAGTNAQLDGVRISWGTGIDTVCFLEAVYSQRGQLGALTGTLFCGPLAGAITIGTVQVSGLQVSEHGFSGSATLTRDACTYGGHFGGVATN
jgi:hypothetical protein